MHKRGLVVLAWALIGSTAFCKCPLPGLTVLTSGSNSSVIAGGNYLVTDSGAYYLPFGDSIRVSAHAPSSCPYVDLRVYRNDSLLYTATSEGWGGSVIRYVSVPGHYRFVAITDGVKTCIVDLRRDLSVSHSGEQLDAMETFALQGVGRDLQLASPETMPFRLDLFNLSGALVHSVSGQSGPERISVSMPFNVEGMIVAVATWPTAIVPKRVFIEPL